MKRTFLPTIATLCIVCLAAFGSHAQSQVQVRPQVAKPVAMPSQAAIADRQNAIGKALGQASASNGAAQLSANGIAAEAAARDVPGSRVTVEDFKNLASPGSVPAQASKEAPSDLMIFVSMSMPEDTLRAYAEQAKRFNGVLIMRGFVNDKLSDTRKTLQKLNASGASWQISPEPFKHFKIDKVPAIVLATAESARVTEEGCAAPETFTSVFGDMSIHAALDRMSLRAIAPVAKIAQAKLEADRKAAR